jgi:hypothetical protein
MNLSRVLYSSIPSYFKVDLVHRMFQNHLTKTIKGSSLNMFEVQACFILSSTIVSICVLGITKYYRLLFENPAKFVPRHGSEKIIREHLLDIEKELGMAFRCCYFNYHIKKYFQY